MQTLLIGDLLWSCVCPYQWVVIYLIISITGSNVTTISSDSMMRVISTLSNITVNLPVEVFNSYNSSNAENSTGLVFVVYPLSSLFPLDEGRRVSNLLVGTPVVGVAVANLSVSKLNMPVLITLPILLDTEVRYVTVCFQWSSIFMQYVWNSRY